MTTKMVKVITEVCVECGCAFERPPGRRQSRCGVCRQQAMTQAQIDQHVKSGEHYENAARKQYRYWRDEMRRLGLRL